MFYLFHGKDDYSRQETLADLQSKLGDAGMLELNTARFEGARLTFSELRHACDSVPFLASKRLVIVNDLFAQKPAFQEELLAYLPHLPETTRLVFLESRRLPANHPLVKLAGKEKTGFVKDFDPLEGVELAKWIRQQVAAAGSQITPAAAQLLAANVGSDLHALANEIEKLSLYKAGKTPIDETDVARLSPYVAEANIFELVDALGNRERQKGVLLLQRKINEGSDPFYLFAMFVRQFRLLIQVKELAEAGRPLPAIVQRLKLHSFVAGKVHQQSQKFSLSQLEQIYSHLLDIDVNVKTGRMEMATALELLVVGLTN